LGPSRYSVRLAGHAGDWRQGKTDWQAYRLSTPLIAFETTKHEGTLGRSFSCLSIDNPNIRVLALKKSEISDEIVVRLVETGRQTRSAGHTSSLPDRWLRRAK
jgi:alpha-mannosidase